MEKNFGGILVAAGSSTRMGGTGPKVLLPLAGKPVLWWSLEAMAACGYVCEIVLVVRAEDLPAAAAVTADCPVPVRVVTGGATRQESVEKGAAALSDRVSYVLVHDGARPLASPALFDRVCRDALEHGAATAAVPAKDTCKLGGAFAEAPLDRSRLFNVQTPQAFKRDLYLYALEKARQEGRTYTDDCGLIEAAGGKVKLTAGEYRNLKLTTPEDLAMIRALAGEGGQRAMRIGHGYDVHRLVPGRKLILGGVEIPWDKGLLGHSDADVLLHAAADAVLGALALGDIGHLFPDTDPQYEGADSLVLFGRVIELAAQNGWRVGNLDVTVVAQRPKLAPYIGAMRQKIAQVCAVPPEQVSVKATTEEGLGFTGAGEGISATAVCLMVPV